MEIKELQIQNFCAIGEARIELSNRGLLLIQGVNQDDTSAKSNGAGKSSIVDALCWCDYGTTARGESGDAIVNSKAKKDCFVKQRLEDAGTEYIIERYRKHTVHKNQTFVWQVVPGGTNIPLHKATEKETQEVIEKIMGCSLPVFVGSIYAGQEKMPDLPGMTDKFLKLLVEEAAGVEELADAYELANKERLAIEKDLALAFRERDIAKVQVDNWSEQVEEAQEQEKLFEDTRKDRAREALKDVPALQRNVVDLTAKLATMDKPAKIKLRDDFQSSLAGHSAMETKLMRLNKVVDASNRLILSARHLYEQRKEALEHAKDDLAHIEDRVGKPCGECGKVYAAGDIAAARVAATTVISDRTADLSAAVVAFNREKVEYDAAVKERDDFKATIPDVSSTMAQIKTLQEWIDTVETMERDLTKHQDAITRVKTTAAAKLTEPNPWTPHVASRFANFKAATIKWADATAQAALLEDKYALAQDACTVFGPAGVRAHILDTVTPFLNHQTSEYLGTLADGNIHATWSTLTANAKGELKEKFSIAVENDHGGKSFGLQSGGEKRKVRIATALALQDMVASRATKPINIFIADEVDHALDDAGLERLMSVLDKKAKERGTVLVISHNALTDWIDQAIVVTKKGGKSTVAGDTVATF